MPANLEESLDLLRRHQIPVREHRIKALFYETDFSARKKSRNSKSKAAYMGLSAHQGNFNEERQSREKKWRECVFITSLRFF